MPLNIRNEAIQQLAKKLAARKHTNKTDAVKLALENELRRRTSAASAEERPSPDTGRVTAAAGRRWTRTRHFTMNSAARRDVLVMRPQSL